MLFKENSERFGKNCLHRTAHFRISQLSFCLTFKLWFRHFYANDRRESFTGVVSGKICILFLEESFIAGIGVERAGERRAESCEVWSSIRICDVVCETMYVFVIIWSVLKRHFYINFLERFVNIKHALVLNVLFQVEIFYIRWNTAFKMESIRYAVCVSFIPDLHFNSCAQVRLLSQVINDGANTEFNSVKNCGVRLEANRCSRASRFTNLFHLMLGHASLELLLPKLAVTMHFRNQLIWKRVHDRNTHAVQSSWNLVSACVAPKFSSRMQFC